MAVENRPGEEKIVKTMCICHCGGTCLLHAHVRNGVITRIETDNGDEPQFRACLRGRAYRQRVYAPDRLKYPLKRTGKRGEGRFARISWDEALDTVARELTRVKEAYGPESVLLVASGGDTGWFHGGHLVSRLLIRTIGGFSTMWGWFSNGGGKFASLVSYGTLHASSSRDDLLNSRLIIMWGINPSDTVFNTNTGWYLTQARDAGIRIVSVDPRYTPSTAALAQQWIPIRPGTDTAMLVAMAHVMIAEGLHDRAFLDRYTVGFDRFRDYLMGKEDGVPKTPEWAERITGVPSGVIAGLAREYATTKPAALLPGIGPGRTAYGEQYHRAAITLAAMTGNVGIHGGNAAGVEWQGNATTGWTVFDAAQLWSVPGQRMKGGGNPVDNAPARKGTLEISDRLWKGWSSSARVHRVQVADALLKGRAGGYPADYRLLYVMTCSYLTQYLNSNKIARALHKPEFIVVHEQFMTPTARFADIVLPANTLMERNDLTVGGATPIYGRANKVVDSLYESKSHFEICNELAVRMGVSDYTDKTEEQWIEEAVRAARGIPDFETFKSEAICKVRLAQPFIPFEKQIADPANNPFPTPSGRIEIYSPLLADMNNPELPPIPKYVETWESCNDPLAKKYPLQLITTHFKRRAHSQFDNIPWLRELQPQAALISSADARARGIRDGDMVRVFNDRGQMVIPARVTERIMPGVVDVPQGAWYDPDARGIDRAGCANVLTRDAVSPGEAFPSNTALVQVEKFGEA